MNKFYLVIKCNNSVKPSKMDINNPEYKMQIKSENRI